MSAKHTGQISIRAEIKRKLIHLSSLWIPFIYLFLDKVAMIYAVGSVALIALSIESLRTRSKKFNSLFIKAFKQILRKDELNISQQMTGAGYFMFASFLTIFIFSKEIAIISLLILIICDTFASIVGRLWGRDKILNKSFQGFLAFLICGIIIVSISDYYFFLYNIPMLLSGYSALFIVATLELFSSKLKMNDNFIIPLFFAFFFNCFLFI